MASRTKSMFSLFDDAGNDSTWMVFTCARPLLEICENAVMLAKRISKPRKISDRVLLEQKFAALIFGGGNMPPRIPRGFWRPEREPALLLSIQLLILPNL